MNAEIRTRIYIFPLHAHIVQNLRLLYSFFIFFGIRRFDANCLSQITAVCIGQQYRIQAVDELFEEEEDNELIYFYASNSGTVAM